MNFLKEIESIRQSLTDSGFVDVAQKILDLQLSGGTGGEVLISVCFELKRLEKERYDAYVIVENEAKALVDYANSIGLYPD